MLKKSHSDVIFYEIIAALVFITSAACLRSFRDHIKLIKFPVDGNTIKNKHFVLSTVGSVKGDLQYKTMIKLITDKMPVDHLRLSLKIRKNGTLERNVRHLNGLSKGESQLDTFYVLEDDHFESYTANYSLPVNIPELRYLVFGAELNLRSEKIIYLGFILGFAAIFLTITDVSNLLLTSLFLLAFNPFAIKFSGMAFVIFTNFGFFLNFKLAIRNKILKEYGTKLTSLIYSIVSFIFGFVSIFMVGYSKNVMPPSNPLFVLVGLLALQIIYISGESNRSSNVQLSLLSSFCLLLPYIIRVLAPVYYPEFEALSIAYFVMPIASLYGIFTIVAVTKFADTEEVSENVIGYIARESSGSSDGNSSSLQIKKIRNIGVGVTVLLVLPAIVYVFAAYIINSAEISNVSTSIKMYS